jgi:Tol biopolymer transport system component
MEIWVVDINEQRKTKLYEQGYWGSLAQAAWLPDESAVIFQVGGEGGSELYLADIKTGSHQIITTIVGWWGLSPDGKNLAAISLTYEGQEVLKIFSIENGESFIVNEDGWEPADWSKDGRYLYYWTKPAYYEDKKVEIRAYDVVSGAISTFIDGASLSNLSIDFLQCSFSISPEKDKIAFWGPHGHLWVVFLLNK